MPRLVGADYRTRVRSPGERLVEVLDREPLRRAAITPILDALVPTELAAMIAALPEAALRARLYVAFADAPPVTLTDLVPPEVPPLSEVIYHQGTHSRLAFALFEKRFCRPPASHGSDELWGFNHQPLAWFTGPGYFVVHEDGARGAAIDYREVPPERPPQWPKIKPNDRGLSRLVYRDKVDYIRRVSRDVFIGATHRNGEATGKLFVLWREGP